MEAWRNSIETKQLGQCPKIEQEIKTEVEAMMVCKRVSETVQKEAS